MVNVVSLGQGAVTLNAGIVAIAPLKIRGG